MFFEYTTKMKHPKVQKTICRWKMKTIYSQTILVAKIFHIRVFEYFLKYYQIFVVTECSRKSICIAEIHKGRSMFIYKQDALETGAISAKNGTHQHGFEPTTSRLPCRRTAICDIVTRID